MQKCLIYDNSLRYSKGILGVLALLAFLLQNQWLVLAAGFLMCFGVFSIKLNILYQFHVLVLRKLLKIQNELIKKETEELRFVSCMGGNLFFISFLFLHFDKFVNLAWVFVLMISLLMFLSYFVGVCAAASMYVFFKKFLRIVSNKQNEKK